MEKPIRCPVFLPFLDPSWKVQVLCTWMNCTCKLLQGKMGIFGFRSFNLLLMEQSDDLCIWNVGIWGRLQQALLIT